MIRDLILRAKCKLADCQGVSTIEIILILVVFVMLVLIFKNQLIAMAADIFSNLNSSVEEIYD